MKTSVTPTLAELSGLQYGLLWVCVVIGIATCVVILFMTVRHRMRLTAIAAARAGQGGVRASAVAGAGVASSTDGVEVTPSENGSRSATPGSATPVGKVMADGAAAAAVPRDAAAAAAARVVNDAVIGGTAAQATHAVNDEVIGAAAAATRGAIDDATEIAALATRAANDDASGSSLSAEDAALADELLPTYRTTLFSEIVWVTVPVLMILAVGAWVLSGIWSPADESGYTSEASSSRPAAAQQH